MKKCTIGGQAVMEGVMMKSPTGIAMAVREPDGNIALEIIGPYSRQKGHLRAAHRRGWYFVFHQRGHGHPDPFGGAGWRIHRGGTLQV